MSDSAIPSSPVAYKKKYKEYAADYGVSLVTVKRWAKKAYPMDEPDKMPSQLGLQKNASDSSLPLTLHQKKELKLDKEIEKLAIANAIAKGEYTENSKVREDLSRIATAMRAALMRLESDLPGVLAGLDSSDIQKKLREKHDEIMLALSDSTSSLYLPTASCSPSPRP